MSVVDTPPVPSEPVAPQPAPTPLTPGQKLADAASHPTVLEHAEPPHPYDEPKPRTRGRKASAADFPVIRDLNGLLKDLDPKGETEAQRTADAPRVAELKAKLRKALEIGEAAPKPEPKAEPEPRGQMAPQPMGSLGAWTEAEPTLQEFIGKSDDPYLAHARALAKYDRRKDAYDQQQAYVTQQQQAYQQAVQQEWQKVEQGFAARVTKLAQDQPADFAKLQSSPKLQNLPPIMDAAIKLSPTAEADLLHWLDDPTVLDDLRVQTFGKPVTPEFVTYVQRKLSARPSAGTTGAAGVRPVLVAPRPPTPVRTGAVSAGAPPDDEDDSLDAHARKYGVGSRRR